MATFAVVLFPTITATFLAMAADCAAVRGSFRVSVTDTDVSSCWAYSVPKSFGRVTITLTSLTGSRVDSASSICRAYQSASMFALSADVIDIPPNDFYTEHEEECEYDVIDIPVSTTSLYSKAPAL